MDVKMSNFDCVREWHHTFNVPIADKPTLIPEDRRNLRIELIKEEFNEFIEASKNNDIVGVADAIGDMLYVIYGAALEWGIPADKVFEEVHRSNMTKVYRDGTIKYREDGKVMKPPTYSPADIKSVLEI